MGKKVRKQVTLTEQVAAGGDAWTTIVELERTLDHAAGLLDSGSPIIAAFRR